MDEVISVKKDMFEENNAKFFLRMIKKQKNSQDANKSVR